MTACIMEFFDAHAGFVQGISTIALVALTGVYVCLLRRQVRQAKELVDRQANEFKERDQEETKRSICTMVVELEINKQDICPRAGQPLPAPLLDAAYESCLWAVRVIGTNQSTQRALGDAYLCIRQYNVLYEAAKYAERADKQIKHSAARDAWKLVQKAIEEALEKLRGDPVARDFIGESERT